MGIRKVLSLVSCVMVVLAAGNGHALASHRSLVQSTFYDLVSGDGVADHADAAGLINTPWKFHQQKEMSLTAYPRVDAVTARQLITIPDQGGYGDARILQRFRASRLERYAASGTVSFSNVKNPDYFWARLVISAEDSSGVQLRECRSEIMASRDVKALNMLEPPAEFQFDVDCQLPDDPSVYYVVIKIGAFSQFLDNAKGSGTVTIHEVSFEDLTVSPT